MQQISSTSGDGGGNGTGATSVASGIAGQPVPAAPEKIASTGPQPKSADQGRLAQEQSARESLAGHSAVALILEARRRLEFACSLPVSAPPFPEQITGIRLLIREACNLSEEVALATGLLHSNGRYSIRHSVDVAVACQVVGSAIEMRDADLTSMVCAALTMNISMLALQDTLHTQLHPPAPIQRQTIQEHPAQSEATLLTLGVDDELWLKAVRYHHAAAEGNGQSLWKSTDEKTAIVAELISLADVYYARTTGRANRPAVAPSTVLKMLFLGGGTPRPEGQAAQFIKALGVFPPGTAVRLRNGEICVVTGRGKQPTAPRVCAITDSEGMPLIRPALRDTAEPQFSVAKVLDWSAVGNPPRMRSLWGEVAGET
jgi:HD-GYP domain-containing protein (c-di-GMP phosphodiesterase class II)